MVGEGLLRQQVVPEAQGAFPAGSRQISANRKRPDACSSSALPIRVETNGIGPSGHLSQVVKPVPRHPAEAFGEAAVSTDGDRETLIECRVNPIACASTRYFTRSRVTRRGRLSDGVSAADGMSLRAVLDTEYAFHAGDWLDLDAIVWRR